MRTYYTYLTRLYSLFGLLCIFCFLLNGCGQDSNQPAKSSNKSTTNPPPVGSIQLVFTYGSEKQLWLEEVTNEFNAAKNKITSGQIIQIQAIPMGSGETIDEILAGQRQTHLISPASAVFIKLGNAQSKVKTGKEIVSSTENLVLSPVVIAMWKPMAEALGWGKKPIGWSDILNMAKNPEGWKSYGFPQWGKFKFGHTHPEYSNSGLIALFAQIYAATHKTTGLTLNEVNQVETGQYLSTIQKAMVHYGRSTGFFSDKMMANGPGYLSAAVLYENNVIESYKQKNLPFPIVAVYPKEGTFWSDHPVGIVEREWVTPAHREAAKVYLNFLLAKPQQEKALQYGFRPADVSIPLTAPIDTAHGVDPMEPKTTLEVPSPEITDAIIKAWQQHKKRSNIVLVIDTSGSMRGERINNARLGALQMLEMLNDSDYFSLLPFNNNIAWAAQTVQVGTQREKLKQSIQGLFAEGGTALYDATKTAYDYLVQKPQHDKISAVVVLTDGADTNSRLKLGELVQTLQFDSEKQPIRIFTIGYGEADKKVLESIANATQAKFYEGTPTNLITVFKEISTFF